MYCPKCNSLLEEDRRGWLRCSSGQLEFSIDVSRRLRAMHGERALGSEPNPTFTGLDFFCPGCGIAIPKGTADATCSSCGVALRPFVFALIELHPHGNGAGAYF